MQMPSSYRVDPDTLARFMELRADVLRHAVDAILHEFPTSFSRPGASSREACAEDLGYHLDFLQSTLETGDIAPFLAYLTWWSQVLRSRNLPTQSIAAALNRFAVFFDFELGAPGAALQAVLSAGQTALRDGLVPTAYDQPCPQAWDESLAYCDAAVQGRRHEASALFDSATQRANVVQAAVHVIQPALYDVGKRWQTNRVSVAQEHMAAALSQTLMAQAMGRAHSEPENGQHVLFACCPGNHHTIGLRMVADAFELQGWFVDYLGANTPMDALVEHVRVSQPQLVGLSVSMPQQLRSLRESVSRLRSTLGDACPRIGVGGLVFNQFPQLATVLGVEVLGSDAHSASLAAPH